MRQICYGTWVWIDIYMYYNTITSSSTYQRYLTRPTSGEACEIYRISSCFDLFLSDSNYLQTAQVQYLAPHHKKLAWSSLHKIPTVGNSLQCGTSKFSNIFEKAQWNSTWSWLTVRTQCVRLSPVEYFRLVKPILACISSYFAPI